MIGILVPRFCSLKLMFSDANIKYIRAHQLTFIMIRSCCILSATCSIKLLPVNQLREKWR